MKNSATSHDSPAIRTRNNIPLYSAIGAVCAPFIGFGLTSVTGNDVFFLMSLGLFALWMVTITIFINQIFVVARESDAQHSETPEDSSSLSSSE
jgi:hypothetical protein